MTALSIAAAVCLASSPTVFSQESPYYPDVGPAAIHQRTLELQNVSVVLSLALEPGEEDLATIAALRMETGARVVSAFVTNGESTPSDLNGDIPSRVAGRRKTEAYQAAALLGADAYFLNLPDFGVAGSLEEIAGIWKDSLVNRLAAAISLLKPDVILVAHDYRESEGDSLRWKYLLHQIPLAVNRANDRDLPIPWAVDRVFIEQDRGPYAFSFDLRRRHPLWNRTYEAIGARAARLYASLWVQRPVWDAARSSCYGVLFCRQGVPRAPFASGLPRITPLLTGTASLIEKVVGRAKESDRAATLDAVASASGGVDRLLKESRNMSHLERRVVAAWRNGLEDLRCSLLGIHIETGQTDSLLAERQLFVLPFTASTRKMSRGKTEILFPAALNGAWYINETSRARFPFTIPSEFRIVTPETMQLNTPSSQYGLVRHEMRTMFPFVIIHDERDPTRDFAYRKSLPLEVGPVRGLEILTPVVRIIPGERLLLSLLNVSRDPYRGEAWVGDSVVKTTRIPIMLSKKDELRTDALPLAWHDNVPDGDYLIDLRIGKGSVGHFLARKFETKADTSIQVGLVTGLASSPMEDALRRLGMKFVLLDSNSLNETSLDRCRVVVLDRDALRLDPRLGASMRALGQWVQRGGHLVILPQHRRDLDGLPARVRFRDVLLPPSSEVRFDSSSLMTAPNAISRGDLDGWIVSRARVAIDVPGESDATVHMSSTVDGRALLTSEKIGEGKITTVALDLTPQLQFVQTGAFRLFANLISY